MCKDDAPKDGPTSPETTNPSSALYDDPTEMLLDEREAAHILRVSPSTVRNERQRGKLGFTPVGARIFYTRTQIADYLQRQTVDPCVNDSRNNGPDRSAITGSARSQDGLAASMPGAGLGSIHELDKHAVSALARQIFTRRASSSRTGSLRTRVLAKPPPKTS